MNSVLATFSFASSPQVVSGDPSEKSQKGFPITHVGNNCDGGGVSDASHADPSRKLCTSSTKDFEKF
jgi:hypothetical protein